MMLEYSALLRWSLPIIVCMCGIFMLWASAALIQKDSAYLLYAHPAIYSNVTGDVAFFAQSNALFSCIIGATIGIISSIAGCGGAFIRSKILYGLFVVLAWASALTMIISGALFLNSLSTLGTYKDGTNILRNPNTPGATPLPPAQQSMLDYGASLFNECCVNKSFVEQGAVKACSGSNNDDCPVFSNHDAVAHVGTENLCNCFSSNAIVENYTALIRTWGVCNSMSKVFINVANVPVPGLQKETLKQLTAARYGSEADLTRVPIVGFHQDKVTWNQYFPHDTHNPASKYGFGCGMGYAKGLMWYIDVWYENHLKPIANGGIVLGTFQMLTLCVAFL